jgi:RiboL-PSP-HEPN
LPSKARRAFNESCADIDRLVDIHSRLTGTAPGRRYDVEVLNKAAIVLITSFWEAYCEDLAAEALEHLVNHSKTAVSLPNDLQKAVAKSLKAEAHDLAVWKLADDGWRVVLRSRLADLQQERNKRLNTPKTEQIDELFVRAVGINNVSSRWYWNNMPAQRAKDKLDGYVSLRGEVAHRGRAARTVRKAEVVDYYSHVRILVGRTDNYINRMIRSSTGVFLYGRRVVRRRTDS